MENDNVQLIQDPVRVTGRRSQIMRIICILVSQCLERMGYYGLLINVVVFLNITPYGWSSYNAVTIILVSHCASYFLAIVGAYISDTCAGKFKVIMIGYIMYLFSFLMPFMYLDTWNGSNQTNVSPMCIVNRGIDPYTPPKPRHLLTHSKDTRNFFEESCAILFTISLLMTCSGASFIKAVITPFGADQVTGENNIMSTDSFMHLYYLIINIGILIAYIVTGFIEINVSMFWGYFGSCILLVLSFIFMVIGRTCFQVNPPENNNMPVLQMGGILFSCCKSDPDGNAFNPQMGNVEPRCLNKAKRECGGNYLKDDVESVKRLIHIILVFSTFIFYWACYFQTESYFSSQGLHMKVPKFENFLLPITWLTGFNTLIIVLLIPFIKLVVYPFLEKYGLCPSLYTRMLIGMILSVATMITAGIVERKRMVTFWGEGNPSAHNPWNFEIQTIENTQYYAANMTIFYLIPQYTLSGTAEVFIVVAGLDFAFEFAPSEMKSLVTGIFWCFSGLGSLLGMFVLDLVKGHFIFSSDRYDINYRKPCVVDGKKVDQWCEESRLDYFYYILAGLQTFGLILFVIVVNCVLPCCRALTVIENDADYDNQQNVANERNEFDDNSLHLMGAADSGSNDYAIPF